MKIDDVTPEMLGIVFAELLKDNMDPVQWTEMRHLNAQEGYADNVCASHDFLDANEVMADAWDQVIDEEMNVQDDAHADLWGDAWAYAKRVFLTSEA